MRAWKVFEVEGKPTQLEIKLNQIQQDGFDILSVSPKSFGFMVIAFMDKPFSQPPTRPQSGATAGGE
jgi:hypothetical protein